MKCEDRPHSVPLQAHLEANCEIEANVLQSCATMWDQTTTSYGLAAQMVTFLWRHSLLDCPCHPHETNVWQGLSLQCERLANIHLESPGTSLEPIKYYCTVCPAKRVFQADLKNFSHMT